MKRPQGPDRLPSPGGDPPAPRMEDDAFAPLLSMLEGALDRVERAVRSVPADRWDDTVHTGDGGWTRRQLLAHVAANDLRQLVRVRMGAGSPGRTTPRRSPPSSATASGTRRGWTSARGGRSTT